MNGVSMSFVVIARNEVFAIGKCIRSILNAVHSLADYEIIFVDSDSTDGTLEHVLSFEVPKLRAFKITKNPNAAVARNIGIRHAKFEYVFFLDGDVEITNDFIVAAASEMQSSEEVGVVYGKLREMQYNNDYSRVVNEVHDRMRIDKRMTRILRGGIFLSRRAVVQSTGFFDERFWKGQDRDYVLRITSKYVVLAIPVLMGTHHTISYRALTRTRDEVVRFGYCQLGALIRKHLLHFDRVVTLARAEYGLILGAMFYVALLFSVLSSNVVGYVLCAFFIVMDIAYGMKKEPKYMIGRLAFHYVYPIHLVIGLLLHFPRAKETEWREVTAE